MKRRKSDNLHYFQDCESIQGWFGVNSLSTDIKGHSGTYTVITDQVHDYSMTFSRTFSEISSKPIKKIKAAVWCYSTNKLSSGEFCVQIVTPTGETKRWISQLYQDQIKEPKIWTKLSMEIPVPKEAFAPENIVKVFLWNKGTVPVYGDDFEIEFFE